MPLDQTRLDRSTLSPAVQKAVGGPARLMAARGVVPLPTPGELATALYELSLDNDQSVAQAARATMTGLPANVLIGAVGDPKLDRRVLDWLAPRTKDQPQLFDALIRNPAIADETVATLAHKFGDREVEQIATNEQRLLRHPEIIAAMYTNPNARMSTVDRAVELAVRNDVRVPGLAAWDEIARALDHGKAGPADDAKWAKVVATFGDDSEFTLGDAESVEPGEENEAAIERARKKAEEALKDTPFRDLKVSEKIRVATLGNAFQRAEALRDPIKLVAVAAIKSPGVSDIEAARYAASTSLPEEVIRYIASRREWTRLYSIKLSLSLNPKCSIAEASRILPYLREKDLGRVAKSRGVSSAVVAQARKLLYQRSGKKQ